MLRYSLFRFKIENFYVFILGYAMDPSLNDAKEGKLVSTKPLDSEESPENSNGNFCLNLNLV